MQKSKHPNPQTAIANKIKKWVETAIELSKEKPIFAISITRLTSIKSLCQNKIAAQQFALHLARGMEEEGRNQSCPSHLTVSEWETHRSVIGKAIPEMERYLERKLLSFGVGTTLGKI